MQPLGDAGPRRRRPLDDLLHQLGRVGGVEGQLEVERLVERDAERVLIARFAGGAAAEELGCKVVERAGDAGAARRLETHPCFSRQRQTEVGDDGAAVSSQQHVGGLEVAVDDAGGVRGLKARRRIEETRQHLAPRPRLCARRAADPVLEVLPLDQLHGDPQALRRLADVVDADDVGVVDARDRLRFRLQPAGGLAAAAQLALHQLDRHPALELGIVRHVDDAHAALAEQLDDAEPADRCWRGEREGGGLGQGWMGRRRAQAPTLFELRVASVKDAVMVARHSAGGQGRATMRMLRR